MKMSRTAISVATRWLGSDPLEISTFQSATLDWTARNEPAAQKRLALVQHLLRIRRQEIVPRLAGAAFGAARVAENRLLIAHWRMGDGATLRLLANLSDRNIVHEYSEIPGTLIWGSIPGESIPPWSVAWRLEAVI